MQVSAFLTKSACFKPVACGTCFGVGQGAKSVSYLICWPRPARVRAIDNGAQEVAGDRCKNEDCQEAEDAQYRESCMENGQKSASQY